MQLLRSAEIEQPRVLFLLDAAEGVHGSGFQFDLEVERAGCGAASSKVHRGYFFEADVDWWFVDVDEAAF